MFSCDLFCSFFITFILRNSIRWFLWISGNVLYFYCTKLFHYYELSNRETCSLLRRFAVNIPALICRILSSSWIHHPVGDLRVIKNELR